MDGITVPNPTTATHSLPHPFVMLPSALSLSPSRNPERPPVDYISSMT